MLPMETFQFHLSNTFQMCHKCVCWLQCSKIDPDLEMFLRCSHLFLGTLAPVFFVHSVEFWALQPTGRLIEVDVLKDRVGEADLFFECLWSRLGKGGLVCPR